MAQLFAQQDRQPDVWVMSGAPTATVVYLSLDTTINYSSGAPDTLHANMPAVIYGTSNTAFDRSLDVWVPLTVRASGVLSIIKESLLATIAADYVAMARVELHGIKPYQPEPYLASGGLGNQSGTTVTVISDTAARALALWNGSSNDAPPSNWQTTAFDDSAWPHAVITADDGVTYVAGAHTTWPPGAVGAGSEQALLRQHVSLPAGSIVSAQLVLYIDYVLKGLYVNGTALGGVSLPQTFPAPYLPVTLAVPPTDLVAAADNVLAIWAADDAGPINPGNPTGNFDYVLTVRYAGSGQAVAASGTPAEGDLLYYHNGAWTDLPLGSSGQRLASDGTDPYWASGGSGTVSSVALAGPTGTSVSGSPVTSSGTITLSWASQSANTFLGAPNGSSGAPTFRALVGNDLPVDASTIVSSAGTIKGNYQAGSGVSISGNTISATGSGGSVTSVALSMPGIFSVSGSPVTTSGTLAVSLATQSAHMVFAGPSSGSAAAPTFRALQGSDLPAAAAAGGHIHAHGHFL